MSHKFLHFVQYNNAIPILMGVLFLGSGVAFASSEEVRDTVLNSTQVLRSMDNSRIITADLENYSVRIEITGVTEDDEFYYVTYLLNTIDVVDALWRDVIKERVLQVGKSAIEGKDLGTHASRELSQVRDQEFVRLKETQEIEREIGESQKVVATVYTGLVGKFLDEKTEVFAGYQEVVDEEPSQPYPDHIVANPQPNPTTQSVAADIASSSSDPEPEPDNGTTAVVVGDPVDTEAPTISILGNNPARIALNTQYSDLGAFVSDNKQGTLGYKIFVNGVEVQTVDLDTATTTTYTITYGAQDQVGNTSTANRIVEIFDPAVVVEENETDTATTTPPVTATTTTTVEVPIEEEQTATTTPEQTATTTPVVVEQATTTPTVEEPTTEPEEVPVIEEPTATSTESVIEEPVVTPDITEEVATTTSTE
ncbi:hypothetical protein COB18_00730 [Candidatus Kaiserbacteria bacterium]|nr:MAG: hypothetical protein COB18_00730 [Candidatus Kaiserbacteria bacterium]